jgi:hypothetical protein
MSNSLKFVTVVDGHDRSGKRMIDLVLVKFLRKDQGGYTINQPNSDYEFMSGRYFGLAAGICREAIDGKACCINEVEHTGKGIQLGTCSGAGPDVNINGPTEWKFTEEGGTITRKWKAWDGPLVVETFKFVFVSEGDVAPLRDAWETRDNSL